MTSGNTMKKWFILFLLTFFAGTHWAGNETVRKYIFKIRRNKNRNIVQYSIKLNGADCSLQGDEPVYVFWRDIEEGPNVTSSIKFYEKIAYGIDSQTIKSKFKLEVRLKALPEKLVTVESSKNGTGCKVVSQTDINGKTSLFEEVYVFAEEGWIKPTVKWIDVIGKSAAGAAVKQRINKD